MNLFFYVYFKGMILLIKKNKIMFKYISRLYLFGKVDKMNI